MNVTAAYATLGVSNTSTLSDLRRAYKAQLRAFHPDTAPGDVRALHSVTEAYQELRFRRVSTPAPGAWPVQRPLTGSLIDVYA